MQGLREETVNALWVWLRENNIDMTPKQWIDSCLKKMGLTDKDKETRERFRGIHKRKGR